MNYYLNKTTSYTMEEAEQKISAALKEVGFGILTTIDMQATLQKKLGVERLPYKILGACNPTFANQALSKEEKIGILLPCNVTLAAQENGQVDISIMDPAIAMSVVENPALEKLAVEVREKLASALAEV